jgi:hypothetical protein
MTTKTREFLIVAFYTKATPYEEEILHLKADLSHWDLPHRIEKYPNRGSWVLNCGWKPVFLDKMLLESDGKNLLYLDADARIRRNPELAATFQGDLAVYHRNGELLSGTLLLHSNPRTRQLVRRWCRSQERRRWNWDQRVLDDVLKADRRANRPLNVEPLPASYVKIFDRMPQVVQPVIEHMQASRRFKKSVHLSEPPNRKMPYPQ